MQVAITSVERLVNGAPLKPPFLSFNSCGDCNDLSRYGSIGGNYTGDARLLYNIYNIIQLLISKVGRYF
jgi:hypothetical protein